MTALAPYLAACALLVVAGAAKAARPADTARALAGLGHGLCLGPVTLAVRIGAGLEAALGAWGVAEPHRLEAALVALSYVAFAAVVALARVWGGALASCGCFGTPDTPPTRVHLVLDLLLGAASGAVAASSLSGNLPAVLAHQPGRGVPLVAGAMLLAWLAMAAMTALARLHAVRASFGGGRT